jgi:hypothetical protein
MPGVLAACSQRSLVAVLVAALAAESAQTLLLRLLLPMLRALLRASGQRVAHSNHLMILIPD